VAASETRKEPSAAQLKEAVVDRSAELRVSGGCVADVRGPGGGG
jgi:hypothetical protein